MTNAAMQSHEKMAANLDIFLLIAIALYLRSFFGRIPSFSVVLPEMASGVNCLNYASSGVFGLAC
jgi:hypothetical protein